ncbi:carboxypeptidase-like regulatory domain-containing protein [Plebeiibacterium marinum]|uniref:Carboxypeptidase-like regulatory domain-containing protein n=1 Tax=Plebeiibacterium marinum TaxID=2992111 RepID=A0AAE3MI39_9BACT|nr:carboxypeptidase-like regulatory domain-containing protein [Plebeiobacterium marinum]MCW3808062.1 carboxypeptidase-like regulatory domain-containing protein [Plebeiobacterium marinum]
MKYYLIVILSVFTLNVECQNLISGVVLDVVGKPVSYASVQYENLNTGVITNNEGRFSIQKESESKLVVRCLGYQTQSIYTDTLHHDLVITLEPATVNLNEVKVTPVDVEDLMKQAIKNLPKNYPTKTVRLKGLYKQAEVKNNYFNNVFESNVNVYLSGMGKLKMPDVETKIINYEYYTAPPVNYRNPQGYLYTTSLYFHPIIHQVKDYQFEYDGQFNYEGMEVVKIKIDPKLPNPKECQYKGFVCIDKETKGILYMEYSLIPNQIEMKRANGLMQRQEKSQTKILFTKAKPFFKLDYIVEKNLATLKFNEAYYNIHAEEIDNLVNDNPGLAYLKDVEKIDTVFTTFSFFTKDVNYSPAKYEPDELTFEEIMKQGKGKPFDKSRDYSNDFIIETREEKIFKEAVENSAR